MVALKNESSASLLPRESRRLKQWPPLDSETTKGTNGLKIADKLIDGETFELVTCTACGGTHLINPKTGRLLEQAKK